jgi:phosphate transport system substrate-binding protein
MKKTLRSLAAISLAATGLITVATLPASAAHQVKKITCYELTTTALKTEHVTTKACPKGWTRTKPSLQGTNLAGDIDLTVPGKATLAINGSSFDAPLVGATTSGSTGYTAGGNVTFSAYPAAGSGTGRSSIANGSVNIGFSDVPMTAAAGTLPAGATEANFVQVPYALGGAAIGYNLGVGFDNIQLTASEIAQIYDGKITQWSDPQIVATNGGTGNPIGKALTNLGTNHEARNTIKVLYRNAGSGTTEAFTYYLYEAGNSGHAPIGGSPMEGAGGAWAATNILGVPNNAGMAQGLVNTLGSIGYVEYSYVLIPGNDAIQVAQLQDKNGQWLKPSLTNIAAAAAAAGTGLSTANFSITDESGNKVWPLATYSWAIVPLAQTSETTCEAITKYLDWESHYGQAAIAPNEGYVPLPPGVRNYARALLKKITVNGTVCVTQKS